MLHILTSFILIVLFIRQKKVGKIVNIIIFVILKQFSMIGTICIQKNFMKMNQIEFLRKKASDEVNFSMQSKKKNKISKLYISISCSTKLIIICTKGSKI